MMQPAAPKAVLIVVAVSCVFASFLITTAWSSAGSVTGQLREKVIEKDIKAPPGASEPVKIVGIKVREKEVKFSEKLTVGDDWLKGAKFKLRNDSGKKITFIELDVNFPETQLTGPEMSYRINLGQIPSIGYTSKEPFSMPPGGESSIVIDEKRYENLLKLIRERHPISDISKARVQVGFIVFDDGTAWSVAGYLRQDPNNPKRWVPINN